MHLISARRQFNLPRWTGRAAFRDRHDAAVLWLDRHLELIEGAAPWLRPAGRQVRDYCRGRVLGWPSGFVPRFKATVGCKRTVTAVYGFDGPLTDRVRSLGQVIPATGWELPNGETWQAFDLRAAAAATGMAEFRTRWMTDRQVGLTWQPTSALGLPAGQERKRPGDDPPFAPSMRVTWSSRGQPNVWRGDPIRIAPETRNYLPIEVSGPGILELLEPVVARHEHVLTVTIELSYYSRLSMSTRRIRVPRYLLPTTPRPER